MSSLFKSSKPRVTTTRTPYEQDTLSNSLRNLGQTDVTGTAQSGTRDLTSTNRGTSGLSDPSLLGPLKAALSTIDLNPDTGVIDRIIQRREGDTTLPGYAANRAAAVEDFRNTVRGIEHKGAALGRSGDAKNRAIEIAERSLSRGLLDAHDTATTANDNALVSLLGARNQHAYSGLDKLSNLLATTPFERQETSTGSQGEVARESAVSQLLRDLTEKLNSESSTKGFGTQVNVSQGSASPFSQLLGLGTSIAGLSLPGGGSVGGSILSKMFPKAIG